MNKIENNMNDNQNSPFDENGKKGFELPSNYFDSFESKLIQKLELESELQDYAILSSIQKINTFTLPKAYFSTLEEKLDFQTELVDYSTLQKYKSKLSFPNDTEYQELFENKLFQKTESIDELKEYSLLFSVEKQNNFTFPDAYFENLSSLIKEKIYEIKPSGVRNFFHFIFNKKMALSFSIIIIAFFSWLLYPKKISETINEGNCKTLACLEKQEILNNAKAISSFDEDQLIELVNIKKLDNQLNNNKKSDSKNTVADSFINDSNLDEIIDEL
jgi:hypothetical protein